MCLAIPLRLTAVSGNTATAEAMGVEREVRVDFIDKPQIGDYVIVHAGFAIERLPEDQALDDIQAWEEVEDALK